MVRGLFLLFFAITLLFADQLSKEELLDNKIKTFINADVYQQNKAYIDIIFTPKSDYFKQDRLDSVKIVQNLKENGLLNLFFKKPQEIELSFKTNGSSLFFVKVISDTLRDIGYYRYVTHSASYTNSEFTWTISMLSEYATDPMIFNTALQKMGCDVVDIVRDSATKWSYSIDMSNAHLIVDELNPNEETHLKRSLFAYWLNVQSIQKLKIYSSVRNDWYPYIAYYDSSLHLLKVIKKSQKTRSMTLRIPQTAKYIKISDTYTLKNVKEPLVLKSF